MTDLARASGVVPTKQHKFPIYESADDYAKEVGSATEAKKKGPLGGVVHGLAIIETLQPYHADADARHHPWALIQRFSNSDKHTEIARLVPISCGPFVMRLDPPPAERVDCAPRLSTVSNGQYIASRVRFAPPFPTQPKLKTEFPFRVAFATNPIGKETVPRALTTNVLGECYASVNVLLLELQQELRRV